MEQNYIRNFCIIAHIDHGKSTLADRLLEITNTVDKRKLHDQYLDTLELEQERGITIKLQTARMRYNLDGQEYILNLIDTPGHVDFAYEVSRSLAACEGAVLLVDATQGVEAQTISNAFKALEHDLTIIPVINKIDLPNAEPEKRAQELCDVLGFRMDEIIYTSGKTGTGVDELIRAIIQRVPPPKGSKDHRLQCLIFDSFFDEHKGVIAQVKVVNGEIKPDDLTKKRKLKFVATQNDIVPLEIGYVTPIFIKSDSLKVGEVGYIATAQKDIQQISVGDTVTFADEPAEALVGYEKPKAMLFASLYPTDADRYSDFRDALEKLALNDASLSYVPEVSTALGAGFRCGFLGLLHMEIVQERLEREYDVDLVVTAPSVEYKVKLYKDKVARNKDKYHIVEENGEYHVKITSAAELPEESLIEEIQEPWCEVEIITPEQYIGDIMQLCQDKRAVYKDTVYVQTSSNVLANNRVIIKYEMPFHEIITDFFDRLKSISHGYASLDYRFKGFIASDIVKLSILINGQVIDALSMLIERKKALYEGKRLVEKLKTLIPRHQFKIPIQAAVGSKVIAREDIPPYRKDVLKGLYGGDHRRKMKHLERQKEGKKRLKQFGSVTIPQQAFLAVLRQ
jgi:GTP-binding protein LepA